MTPAYDPRPSFGKQCKSRAPDGRLQSPENLRQVSAIGFAATLGAFWEKIGAGIEGKILVEVKSKTWADRPFRSGTAATIRCFASSAKRGGVGSHLEAAIKLGLGWEREGDGNQQSGAQLHARLGPR